MRDIWFTSDFHFGHHNIIRYCNRHLAGTDHFGHRCPQLQPPHGGLLKLPRELPSIQTHDTILHSLRSVSYSPVSILGSTAVARNGLFEGQAVRLIYTDRHISNSARDRSANSESGQPSLPCPRFVAVARGRLSSRFSIAACIQLELERIVFPMPRRP